MATSAELDEPWNVDADGPDDGVDLGLELSATPGLGHPVGDGSEYFDPGFHMGLAGGMRIGAAWIGAHFDYTPLVIDPPPGMVVTGEASLLMVAAGAKFHLNADGLVDPVLGARLGYFDLTASGPGGYAESTGVALGADLSVLFRVPPSGDGPRFLVGPTFGVSTLFDSGDLGSMAYLNGGLTLGFEHML